MTFLATLTSKGLDFGSEANEIRWRVFCENNKGKKVRVEIPKTVRSNQQNRFYWFYLGIIERELGQDQQELHEFFKRKFIAPKFITVLGEEMKIPDSTQKLTKVEFGEYMEKICARCGVPIPDPAEAGFLLN